MQSELGCSGAWHGQTGQWWHHSVGHVSGGGTSHCLGSLAFTGGCCSCSPTPGLWQWWYRAGWATKGLLHWSLSHVCAGLCPAMGRAGCLGDEGGTGWDSPEDGNICGVSPGSAHTGGEISTEGERIWGLLCMNPSRGVRTSDIPLAGNQPLSSPLESRIGFGQSGVLGPVSAGHGGALVGSAPGGGRRNLLL